MCVFDRNLIWVLWFIFCWNSDHDEFQMVKSLCVSKLRSLQQKSWISQIINHVAAIFRPPNYDAFFVDSQHPIAHATHFNHFFRTWFEVNSSDVKGTSLQELAQHENRPVMISSVEIRIKISSNKNTEKNMGKVDLFFLNLYALFSINQMIKGDLLIFQNHLSRFCPGGVPHKAFPLVE